jgi:hypothetical protein
MVVASVGDPSPCFSCVPEVSFIPAFTNVYALTGITSFAGVPATAGVFAVDGISADASVYAVDVPFVGVSPAAGTCCYRHVLASLLLLH